MVTVMRGCTNCRVLERKVARLEEQLAAQTRLAGARVGIGKVMAVMGALGVEPAQARLLIRLYQAGPERYTPTSALVDEMRNPDGDPGTIKTQVCRIRRRLGKDFIETFPERLSAYRLSTRGGCAIGAAMAGATS